jgi:uncharacterized protein YndB with AHSA1/START domain
MCRGWIVIKKIMLGIGGVVALAIVVIVGLAATKPATFRVERKTTIEASPDAVFPNLEDFHRWGSWSPWEKLDPQMHKTYGGPASGPGSTYAWSGNDDVGEGRMTVISTRPNERVEVKLEFLKPFEATNTTVYELTPVSGGTEVTWSMEGPNSFMGKVISVFADMDAMIGKDFEEGLANLKRVSETGAAAAR